MATFLATKEAAMATSNEDRLKGTGNVIKGKAKAIVGEVTDDADLKSEGAVDKLKGKAQQLKADVKDAVTRGLNKI